MKKLIFGIITLFIISCNEKQTAEFSLRGTTNGIENGTYIFLHTDDVTDSTMIGNNAFYFKTKLSKSPMEATLRTSDWFQRRVLWLENVPMTFDASKTDFINAKVSGSESENLSQTLYPIADNLSRKEQLEMEMKFVENNPNSVVSASILSVYSTTWGKEKTMELFNHFPEKIKESNYGQNIAKYIELNKDPKIGERYADFEMTDQNGKSQKLSNFKGKTVLLEFWSSWCGPCRKENPNLVKTYEKFKPKGFEILAVSLDEDRYSWIEAIRKDSLNWVHVSDLKGQGNEASLIYGINGIPDNFLISENGEIIGRNLRGGKLNEKLSKILE
ncbi:TlpA disulfide reductase family protein [Maribacter polysaccharolyticus]|uniref:TlpA disulfide reductase family protein n=1 Tax=Maribacter polysaccharolyticus TaxID=3020831 RepID=UPI00237F1403|nr:TlpA disulfide reductase family protein [Maribacter polysaccharolyticus]MDE3741297.1 TlpA disulfide reductase family protein [Maribacter polysaccharolyticus]